MNYTEYLLLYNSQTFELLSTHEMEPIASNIEEACFSMISCKLVTVGATDEGSISSSAASSSGVYYVTGTVHVEENKHDHNGGCVIVWKVDMEAAHQTNTYHEHARVTSLYLRTFWEEVHVRKNVKV